jgi:hypothetical protein
MLNLVLVQKNSNEKREIFWWHDRQW